MNPAKRSLLVIPALLACASPPPEPLGSAANPVRCDGKRGTLAYLGRLRCPSGGTPQYRYYQRGPTSPYGNETDRFELRCVFDDRSSRVFVDRHHPGHVEEQPVPGFVLARDPF